MMIVKWILGSALGLLSLNIILFNWIRVLKPSILGKDSGNIVGYIGAILGVISLLIIPIPGLAKWWWVPPLVDFGTVPVWIFGAIMHAYKRPSRSKPDENNQEKPL